MEVARCGGFRWVRGGFRPCAATDGTGSTSGTARQKIIKINELIEIKGLCLRVDISSTPKGILGVVLCFLISFALRCATLRIGEQGKAHDGPVR